MAKAAIIGFGTVGGGVYDIITSHDYEKKAGEKIEIAKILDIRDFDTHEAKDLFTKNFEDIKNDDGIEVVAETMGGLHPAYEYTKELLMSGKSVVTSNKELVATYGTELMKIADDKNVNYCFEASVGGGIPIIRPMADCIVADRIERIVGILNGTTNFILTQMFEKGERFDDALLKAQKLGYAERNPAADVEGHDACRKIAILSSLAWGKFVDYNEIPTQGISDISTEDVKCAEKLGFVIKLLGYASCGKDGKVTAMVRPMMIRNTSPLAGVCDVFNAIMVTGDLLGDTMFYGKGAGKLPTASAVTADIINCIKQKGSKKHSVYWEQKQFMKDPAEDEARFFVRTSTDANAAADTFPNAEFVEPNDNTAFLTNKISEKLLKEKLDLIGGAESVIRILEE